MSTCPFGTSRTRRWIPWLSIAGPSLGWLVFGLYPSLATVVYSLTQYSGLPGTPLNFCGLCNYRNALSGSFTDLSSAVAVTLEYVVGVTVLQIGIGLGLALLLRHRRRGFGVYRALSGGASAFLGDSHWALPLIILINVWMFSGYTVLVYIAALRRIPADLYEAAALDGAGRLQAFRRITWPMLASATTVNVFLTAMGSIGEYSLILVLTDGQFGTKTIGMYMFDTAFGQSTQLGYGSMLAMVQFLITVLVGGVLLLFLRRREVAL